MAVSVWCCSKCVEIDADGVAGRTPCVLMMTNGEAPIHTRCPMTTGDEADFKPVDAAGPACAEGAQ